MQLRLRRAVALAFWLWGAGTAQAQPAPIKFGQLVPDLLTDKLFVADSGAAAVVLCDYGSSRLQGRGDGFRVVFERITRLKILKKAGYEYATVEIPLYHRDGRSEAVSGLRGFTYNLVNGQVVKTKLEAGGAFLEKRTGTVNVQKFVLPNVREGAVVEYAYTLTSDFLFNFQDWTFQARIPVRWSEYRTSIPVFYKLGLTHSAQPRSGVMLVGKLFVELPNREAVAPSRGREVSPLRGSGCFSCPSYQHITASRLADLGECVSPNKYKVIYQSGQPFAINQTSVGATTLQVDNKVPSGAGLTAGQTVGSLLISAPTEEHRWALENVPAFADEPHMTAAIDYLARLDFELMGEQWPEQPYHDLTGDWTKLSARLLEDEDFGGRITSIDFLKDQLLALAARHPETAARAAAVRALVLAAVRYDGTNGYTAAAPLRRAYDAHRGTAADVNLLLLAALREAGMVAHPLLLSTRDHGRINPEFPLLDRFNYVVALVPLPDGTDLLVDATDPLLPCGTLPERCLNGSGHTVAEAPANSRWVELKPRQRFVHFQQLTLALDAAGGLTGTVHDEYAGYAARAVRAELAELGEPKYLAQLLRRHEGWAVPKLAVAELENPAQPLALNYAFSQSAEAAAPVQALYISPLKGFGPAQNPFQAESRTFAVDFAAPREESIAATLALPAGYELAELPKGAVVELPDSGGRFVYNVALAAPGTVQISSRLTLRKPVYAASEYANLRELYRRLLEKQAEKLVIKKKA